jgi:RNA polymerase sigma-70 factor (ECF subfamily)
MSQDVAEFVRLFTAHEGRLRALAISLVVNFNDAEDVLQQASLAIWKKFEQYQPGTNFMFWAGRFVYLHALRHRRQNAKTKMAFGDAFLEAILHSATKDAMVAELGQREVALDACLRKLSPEHRAMLRARYEEQSNIHDMALIFNRTEQAIHNALSRIRRTLHECINRRLLLEVKRG